MAGMGVVGHSVFGREQAHPQADLHIGMSHVMLIFILI
jgi:hypothetical protein